VVGALGFRSLLLDELPEFGSRVLEVMRQPIEEKVVTISQVQGSLTFPANVMLVAAFHKQIRRRMAHLRDFCRIST
jgi:predicted ATPase with chaperone activity